MSQYFHFFAIIRRGRLLEEIWIHFTQWCFMTSMVVIDQMDLENIFKHWECAFTISLLCPLKNLACRLREFQFPYLSILCAKCGWNWLWKLKSTVHWYFFSITWRMMCLSADHIFNLRVSIFGFFPSIVFFSIYYMYFVNVHTKVRKCNCSCVLFVQEDTERHYNNQGMLITHKYIFLTWRPMNYVLRNVVHCWTLFPAITRDITLSFYFPHCEDVC